MGFLDPAFSDSTLPHHQAYTFHPRGEKEGRKQKVKRLRDEKEGWPGCRARARRLPTPSGKLAPGPSSVEKTDSEGCRAPTAGPGPGLSASLLSGTPAPCTDAGVSTTAGVSTSADVMGAGSSKLVGTDGGAPAGGASRARRMGAAMRGRQTLLDAALGLARGGWSFLEGARKRMACFC